MRAVVLESFGEPEVLKVADIPDPTPGPDEVIVEVAATALNRADLLAAAGRLSRPEARLWRADVRHPRHGALGPGRRPWLACHGVGDGRSGHGDREWRRYAERCAVHERQLLSVPFSVPTLDAAAIPEVFITAWDALVVQGGLTSGRSALVHAGASGVGTAAIQIVKAIGARCSSRRRPARSRPARRSARIGRSTTAAKTSSRRRSSSPEGVASMSCSTSSAVSTSSATSTRSPRRARSCRSVRWGAARRRSPSGRCSTSERGSSARCCGRARSRRRRRSADGSAARWCRCSTRAC